MTPPLRTALCAASGDDRGQPGRTAVEGTKPSRAYAPVTSSPVGPPDELNAGDQERTSSGPTAGPVAKGPGLASKRRRKCGEEAADLSGEDAGFFFLEVLDGTFAQSYHQEDGHGIKLAAYDLHRHRTGELRAS